MQYHSQQIQVAIQAPDLLAITLTPILDAPNTLPAEVSVGIPTAAPPDLFQTRHFISRAALPARAPSIAS